MFFSVLLKQNHFLKIALAPLLLAIPLSALHAEPLADAVRHAVQENPQGLAAQSDVRATSNELLELRGRYLPSFEVFGDIGGESVDNANVLSEEDNGELRPARQIGVSAGLTLFDGYRRANTIYRNAARLDQSIFRYLAASETVALNAVEAYVDLVRHRNLLHVARKNVARHQEILRQIRTRVEGGSSPVSDAFQVEERVFAAQIVATEIEKALADANTRYVEVIGRKPKGALHVPGVPNLPHSRVALVEASLDNNPEIRTADKAVNEAEYERAISRGERLPTISLEGNTSVGADRSGTPGVERQSFIGLRLSWQIYNGGARKFRNAALAEREQQAVFQRDLSLRSVKALAERTWNSFSEASKRHALLSKQVKTNDRIVEQYLEEFDLAKRSLLDVLDAERARFNAQFQQISVRATVQFSRYRMLAVQGKLVDYFGIARPAIASVPNFEERVFERPREIFDITIEPLR